MSLSKRLEGRSGRSFYRVALLCFLALAPTLAADDSFTWIARSACPLPRFEAIGGAAGGKLYQFSGYYTLGTYIKATPECDAYDPVTNTWQRLANIPQPISHSGQVADLQGAGGPIFWLAGGFLGDHPGPSTIEVWKYNINNDSWSAGPPLPDERAGAALVLLGRELHFFGGVIRHSNDVYIQDYGTHWALNIDTETSWRTTTTNGQLLAPMPNPRNHMGGIALDGKIYAIGGQHLGNQDDPQNEVDVYDPATNSWSQAAPMPRAIGHVTANVFIRNGRIVVTTGRMANAVLIPNVIEYDPGANTWSELPPLPAARQSPVSGLVGDQIVVTCGSNNKTLAQTWVSTPLGILPAPWQHQDIGNVGPAGNASTSDYSSSFNIGGSGAGAAGNADSFHYVYQPLNGDRQIVVRVASQDNTSSFAQGGVMIRESLSPGSKHAALLITPAHTLQFQRRSVTGGATSQTVFSGYPTPYWLKLVRSGTLLTSYASSNGSSWTRLASDTVSMNSDVIIGLAVASGTNSSISQVAFDNLNLGPKVSGGPDRTILLPSTATLTRSASDDGLPAGTIGNSWRKISGPGTVNFATTNTSDTIATFSAPGVYTLRLTANDSSLSSTDDVNVTVNSGSPTPTPTPTATPTPTPTATPTPTPGGSAVRINCGGSVYTDSLGHSWLADQYYGGGVKKTYTQAVSGTNDPTLYQSERYGKTLTYNVPVSNGSYSVTLDFAEMFYTAAGKRVFNVALEGQTVLQNFDIYATAGPNTAVQRSFAVTVSDGKLTIACTSSVDNAKFSAIEIVPNG